MIKGVARFYGSLRRTAEDFRAQVMEAEELREPFDEIRDAYWMLKNLRNGLAHGNPAQIDYYRRIIADPQRLPRELETAMERMLNTTGK